MNYDEILNEEPIRKVVEEIGLLNVLKVIKALEDAGFSLTKIRWKKRPDLMPEGVKRGLEIAKEISKKCSDIKGVVRHPEKGYLIPAKNLCQMVLTGKIKDEGLKKVFLERTRKV